MTLQQEVVDLLLGVEVFLTLLPPLPPSTESKRLHLLQSLRGVVSKHGHDTARTATLNTINSKRASITTSTTDVTEPPPGLGSAAPAGTDTKQSVRRSGSLSSRSSSGSYTSNSYTSTSYTSYGYSSYEGATTATPVQEDIYEEFDAVLLRVGVDNALSTTAEANSTRTSTTTSTATTNSATTTPFFSTLRSSISYGKKDKKLSAANNKDAAAHKQKDAKTKKDKLSKKDKKTKYRKSKDLTTRTSDTVNESDVSKDAQLPDTSPSDDTEESPLVPGDDKKSLQEEREEEGSYAEGVQGLPFCSAVACCDRHGILHKKTKGLLRSWRPFHCVVTSGVLFLYAKETDHRQRKSIELCYFDVRVATGDDSGHAAHFLELVAPARKTHTFIARSTNDKDGWIRAMGQYTKNKDYLPPPTPLSPTVVAPAVNTTNTLSGGPVAYVSSDAAGTSPCEQDTLSLAGSEEEEDSFSSDEELYEEVNMEDVRSSSGPSLSEMLEKHLFPSDLSTYYTVPEEDEGDSSPALSTSTPRKLPGDATSVTPTKGEKPARPPPPQLTPDRLVKNASALHTKISQRPSYRPDCPTAPLPPKPAPRFAISPLVCKRLFNSSVLRPLPATPTIKTAEDGEIYTEIEDEDFYEESDMEWSNVPSPCNPPPLPLRGPPPVPNIERLIAKNKEILTEDSEIFEDYDIPGDTDPTTVISARNSSILTDSLPATYSNNNKSSLAPSGPTFSINNSESLHPPIPEKVAQQLSLEEDDSVYKVPTPAHVSEPLYQVPAAIPIPVNNNNNTINNTLTNKDRDNNSTVVDAALLQKVETTPTYPTELYQTPPSVLVRTVSPVTSSVTNNNNVMNDAGSNHFPHKNSIKDSSKLLSESDKTKTNLNKVRKLSLGPDTNSDDNNIKIFSNCNKSIDSSNCLSSTATASSRPNSSTGKNFSVKERIALLNSSKDDASLANSAESPVKFNDDLVVMIDNKEIRLDHANKKAFLESTLNLNSKSLLKYNALVNAKK